jgi:hypothetical protein
MALPTKSINAGTKFRRFNFTLYERLETFHAHIENLFNSKDCPFQILQFQFEKNYNSSEDGKYHAQGFVITKNKDQLRAGNYDIKTKKGSGIKKIFEANVHIEFANGTDDECLAYTSKDYDRCKDPLHNTNSKKGLSCKCDFKDLTKFCKLCNKNCKRTFARISKDPKIAGPFFLNLLKLNALIIAKKKMKKKMKIIIKKLLKKSLKEKMLMK